LEENVERRIKDERKKREEAEQKTFCEKTKQFQLVFAWEKYFSIK